jgi:hypothetical protein
MVNCDHGDSLSHEIPEAFPQLQQLLQLPVWSAGTGRVASRPGVVAFVSDRHCVWHALKPSDQSATTRARWKGVSLD